MIRRLFDGVHASERPKDRGRLMEACADGNFMLIFGYENLERETLYTRLHLNQQNYSSMFFGSESNSILVLCNKQSNSLLVFWRWCNLWEKHWKVIVPECTTTLGSTFSCNVQAYLSAHSCCIYFSVNHNDHKCRILHVQIPELTNKLTSTLLVICFLCRGGGWTMS